MTNLLSDAIYQLPQMPKVVQSLIASFDAPNINADQLARQLATDQVLTAKVLRLANSAHYGASRQIASVNDAVVLLGVDALRTLVLASGVVGTLQAPEGFDIRQFWRNSFDMAALCKWLAGFTSLNKETAFTCGMMHNIGGLIIHIAANENSDTIDAATTEPSLFAELGAELAEHWKFPQSISEAIRHQLTPEQAKPPGDYAHLLLLANCLNALHPHSPLHVADKLPAAPLRHLHIQPSAIDGNLAELDQLKGDFDALLDP
ncbi:HDOD domain-containing protein [Simiduia sp. 21SJ11W-1]|uniref:HDOD domain-containing protein n=1 Tax=Simiduia sp. 21SJ11W-1 TaxID=2909669 RepID=UPI0020A05D45|nr:HDOD domain-containing protein [Simiduia sp. 21SJ11W-1]UTA48797.1 HDOD domain-containing protein [Simiduia sp. 21SJ11W-1]